MGYSLIQILPRRLLSRLAGWLAEVRFPKALLCLFISRYCSFYKINMSEVDGEISSFPTFNDFFTRPLKPDARPIDPAPDSIVSPVDGTVGAVSAITGDELLQAKNIYYSLTDLIGEKQAQDYIGGFQATIYLSPADYHRIHSPRKMKVESVSYFRGDLWPVNKMFVNRLSGLFSVNERLCARFIDERGGFFGLVKVGALIVGKIKAEYTEVCSQAGFEEFVDMPLDPQPAFDKGAEIGHFRLGSTVILLFPADTAELDAHIKEGAVLKMGQRIARYLK